MIFHRIYFKFVAIGSCSLVLSHCSPSKSKEVEDFKKERVVTLPEIGVLGGRSYQHTKAMMKFGKRTVESVGLEKSKQYVKKYLERLGWSVMEQEFTAKTPLGLKKFSNIVARFSRRSDAWSTHRKCVLGAHIDSKILKKFLGVNDALSSVAGLLAMSEHITQKNPKMAEGIELVFFDGEEALKKNIELSKDGLYGSMYYAKRVHRLSSQRLAPYNRLPSFGIVLDMIGHKNLDIRVPQDTPRKLLVSYIKARKSQKVEKQFTVNAHMILDDHYPLQMLARIPMINLIGHFSEVDWWHTSADNLDIISAESLDLSLRVALEILNDQWSN